jgi:hypothetical protein
VRKATLVTYLRTSSSTNAGPDKDSDKRQRAAITAFAKAHGHTIVAEFYDVAVSMAIQLPSGPASRLCSTGSPAMSAAIIVESRIDSPAT